MYAGAITEAMPTPAPASVRQAINPPTADASPKPMALTAKSSAAITITRMRPSRFAAGPAHHAPTAEPSNAQETARPVSTGVSAKRS